MGELLRHKLEALGYGGHDELLVDDGLVSRLVSDLIQASQAGEILRKKASDTALQLELANDKVPPLDAASLVFKRFKWLSEHAHSCMRTMHARLLCTTLIDTSGFRLRQVEVLTRETRRLTTENNHLHTRLVAAADKLDRFERTTQQVHRRLEQRVSEAVQQQQAAAARCERLLKEKHEPSQRLANGHADAGTRVDELDSMRGSSCLPCMIAAGWTSTTRA